MGNFQLEEETKVILRQMEDIQRIASDNYEDDNTLMDAIYQMAGAIGILTDKKGITSPSQDLIRRKLGTAHNKMKKYERNKSYHGF